MNTLSPIARTGRCQLGASPSPKRNEIALARLPWTLLLGRSARGALGFLVALALQSHGAEQCESGGGLNVNVLFASVGASRSKEGFAEFGTSSTPPKYYLTQTTDDGPWSYTETAPGNPTLQFSGSFHSVVQTLISASGVAFCASSVGAYTQTSWTQQGSCTSTNGTCTYLAAGNGTNDPTNPTLYDNAACYQQAVTKVWGQYANDPLFTKSTYIDSQTSMRIVSSLNSTNTNPSITGGSVLTTTLSSEYTTTDLIARTVQDVNDQPMSAPFSGYAEASTRLSTDEDCATVSRMDYQFSFDGLRNVPYTILWDEVTVWDGGMPPAVAGFKEVVYGSGSGTLSSIHSTPPPMRAGFTIVTNVRIVQGADTATSPGGGGCSGCGSSDSAGPGDGSVGSARTVDVRMNMGMLSPDEPAGELFVNPTMPLYEPATPTMLRVSAISRPEIEVIKTTNGVPLQVKTPNMLARMSTLGGLSFQVGFYAPSQVGPKGTNGLYSVSGSPAVVWTFSTPSATGGGPFNEFNATETRGGSSRTFQYLWDSATGKLTLNSPGSLKQEIVTRSWDPTNKVLTEQEQVLTPGGPAVFTRTQSYQLFGSTHRNFARISQSTGAIGSELRGQSLSYDPVYADQVRRRMDPQWTIPTTGAWEFVEVDAVNDHPERVSKRYTQFLSAPTATAPGSPQSLRVHTYSYSSLDSSLDDETFQGSLPRMEVETLLDKEVSRTYYLRSTNRLEVQQATVAGALWNAASNLRTVTRYRVGAPFAGRVWSVSRPDGTAEFYRYSTNATSWQTAVWTGQPNAAGSQWLQGAEPSTVPIAKGTVTLVVVGMMGELLSKQVQDVSSGVVGPTVDQMVYSYDPGDLFHRSPQITYLDSQTTQTTVGCCGVESTLDKDGVMTVYNRDLLKRDTGSTRLLIQTIRDLDASGNVLTLRRRGSDGSEVVQATCAYDSAGRQTNQVNALLGQTSTREGVTNSVLTRTTVNPDLGTRIETYYPDGSLQSMTGTAAHPVRYDYGVAQVGGAWLKYVKEIKLTSNGADTAEWQTTYQDMLDRTVKVEFAASTTPYPSETRQYDLAGRLSVSVDPDGVTTRRQYNGAGELEYTAVTISGLSAIDFGGQDRITRRVTDVASYSGTTVRQTTTSVFASNGSSAETTVRVDRVSVDGRQTWSTVDGVTTSTSTIYGSSGTRSLLRTVPGVLQERTDYVNGRVSAVTRLDTAGNAVQVVAYSYDPHGRLNQMVDARNGATTYAYNNADQTSSVTTPTPGSGGSAQTTLTDYDGALRPSRIRQPDATYVTNTYFADGNLKVRSGSRTYPVEYGYDAQGRMTTMKTWTNTLSGSVAVTGWGIDPYRGWVSNKRDAAAAGADYTYTAAGRLKTRQWARGTPRVTATYTYTTSGDVYTITYNDGVTPSVSYGYDRRGRQTTVTRAGMTTTLGYRDSGELSSESHSGGWLDGWSVANGYDGATGLRNGLNVGNGSGTVQAVSYGYDNAGRWQTVGANGVSAVYDYAANSGLVQTVTAKQGTVTRLTASRQHDFLNRQLTAVSTPSDPASPPMAYDYGFKDATKPGYNAANQRTSATLADGSYWVYGYDALGQLSSGKRYWKDTTPVAGQQFAYVHDEIGNRRSSKRGGDSKGTNLSSVSYAPNALNQYASLSVSAASGGGGYPVDVMGIANGRAKVTVNGAAAERKGEYYRKEISSLSGMPPADMKTVTVSATRNGVTTNSTGQVYLPFSSTVTFTHDADGNRTAETGWTYTWDGENRLTRAETTTTTTAARRRVDFEYDYRGRRVRKKVSTWNTGTSAWVVASDARFVYEGWNLAVEVDALTGTVSKSYVWGMDLSGTAQGAGGVGGLVAVSKHGTSAWTALAAYDGNGNVVGLVDASNGQWVAQYEYGPFGELIRASGPQAKANPFRFSTKFQDDETSLVYYGYRYYDPRTGRWLSRDPIGEKGGVNLLAFVRNEPIGHIDLLGEEPGRFGTFDQDHSYTRTCKHYLDFDLTSAKEHDVLDRVIFQPWGVRYVGGTKEILEQINQLVTPYDSQGRCCKGSCIAGLTLSAHGWVPGTLRLSNQGTPPSELYDARNAELESTTKHLGPTRQRERDEFLRAKGFLQQIKSKMCKGGKISFVSCSAGADGAGRLLKQQLMDLFGSEITVEVFEGNVGYCFGVPWEGGK